MANGKLEFHQFLEIVGKRLGLDPAQIQADAHLTNDLGADSLAVLKIVTDVEDLLNTEIGDLDFDQIQTVEEAFTALSGA